MRKRNIAIVRELLGAKVALNHMEEVRTYIPPQLCNRDVCKYVYLSREDSLL